MTIFKQLQNSRNRIAEKDQKNFKRLLKYKFILYKL